MTWEEDATKYGDKQCLQRDVTEVDVSRRGAVVYRVHGSGQDRKRMSAHRLHVVTR